jgi:biotin carboxyl carrier protein
MLRYCMNAWWERIGATKASGITKLIIAEANTFPEITDFYRHEVIEPGTQLIRRILKRGVDRGEFAIVDMDYAVYGVVAPMIFLIMSHHSQGACVAVREPLDPARYIHSQVETLLAGLNVRPCCHSQKRKPEMKPAVKWTLLAVAAALVVAGGMRLMAARKAQATAAATVAAPAKAQTLVELAPTDVVTAQVREIAQGLPISGTLKAVNTALVKARVAGELQGLTVREGDVVKAGQVVARVDSSDLLARVARRKNRPMQPRRRSTSPSASGTTTRPGGPGLYLQNGAGHLAQQPERGAIQPQGRAGRH